MRGNLSYPRVCVSIVCNKLVLFKFDKKKVDISNLKRIVIRIIIQKIYFKRKTNDVAKFTAIKY